MLAEAIALEVREDVLQRFLADFAHGAWGELPLVALAPDVAGLLQHLGDALQAFKLRGRLLVHQIAHLLRIDGVDPLAALRGLHLRLELVHALHALHHGHRFHQAQRLVAAERIALALHLLEGQHLREIGGQAHQVGAQAVVAEEAVHHVLKLLAHLWGHALHQRGHGLHARRELLE